MSKKDLPILILLFGLWLAWPQIDRHIIRKYFFNKPAPVPTAPVAGTPAAGITNKAAAPALVESSSNVTESAKPAPVSEPAAITEPVPTTPERTAVLANSVIEVVVSSRGATVRTVEMKKKDYRKSVDPNSGPLTLDFSRVPALAYSGLDGLSGVYDFNMTNASGGRTVQFERTATNGLSLKRTMTLGDGYVLKITDEFQNNNATTSAVPVHSIQVGSMHNLEGESVARGFVYLTADTLSPGGEGVQHWGSKIPKWFELAMEEKNLPKIPETADWSLEKPVDWIAAKNKYFVQILTPDGGGDKAVIHVTRTISPAEQQSPDFKPRSPELKEISASIVMSDLALEAHGKFTRTMQYYVGPKKYSELNKYGLHWVDTMEFGRWAPIGKLLLQVLNGIDKVTGNYGVAIMLLTIIIRVLFWPLMHKSTESMKKMQAVQPMVSALRVKYKDNPQKQQQEIMALYKEQKINPLGGCLPTLIQIPVFFALFIVLRSAIELRFAHFLWIRDLSEPEHLLANVLPIPLNILPILMAVTMVVQQKLTPTAGDPAQQKMMAVMMPIMLLFFMYNMASGLTLYWTTQNLLMIFQQLMMQRKKAKAVEPAKA